MAVVLCQVYAKVETKNRLLTAGNSIAPQFCQAENKVVTLVRVFIFGILVKNLQFHHVSYKSFTPVAPSSMLVGNEVSRLQFRNMLLRLFSVPSPCTFVVTEIKLLFATASPPTSTAARPPFSDNWYEPAVA